MEAFTEHELGFSETHRNEPCNKSKSDALAGAAHARYGAHMSQKYHIHSFANAYDFISAYREHNIFYTGKQIIAIVVKNGRCYNDETDVSLKKCEKSKE